MAKQSKTSGSWFNKRKERIAVSFDRVLLHEFDMLEEHRAFVESNFTRAAKRMNDRFNEDLQKIKNEERKSEYVDYMSEEYTSIAETLPRLQWHAQFMVVYSSFEHALNHLSQIVQRRSNFELSFKDISGKGIARAATYFRKVALVRKPFETKEWYRALLLGEVRNAIAHGNGQIHCDQKNTQSLAYRLKDEVHLELRQLIPEDPEAQIILSPIFVKEAITTLRKVLSVVANYELYATES